MSSTPTKDKVIYQDLNDDFYKIIYQDFYIIVHKESGYINGNKLGFSMKSKKRFRDWNRKKSNGQYKQKSTGELLRAVSEQTSTPVDGLIKDFSQIGGQNFQQVRGQYIHRYLLTALTLYYSPTYIAKVSIILDEWKQISKENTDRYWSDIFECMGEDEEKKINRKESVIRDQIAKEEDGKTEIVCKSGRIDVLTETKIIEVKICNLWKHAMGQVLCYHKDMKECGEPWLYLYECKGNDKKHIESMCGEFGVSVKFL